MEEEMKAVVLTLILSIFLVLGFYISLDCQNSQVVSSFSENMSKNTYDNSDKSDESRRVIIKEFEDMPNNIPRRIRNGACLFFGLYIYLVYLFWAKY